MAVMVGKSDEDRKYKFQTLICSLHQLRKEQARYERNFDAKIRKPKYEIPVGSYVFLRKEHWYRT